jgi:uncharacterized tellurite resistance protein B-like protein
MVQRLLDAIGLGREAPPERRGTLYVKLRSRLAELGGDRVEYLTAFAGLLARAAFGDSEVSPAEEQAMADCLRDRAGLSDLEAELVADIARKAAETLYGVEDYLLTRTFNEHAADVDKEILLDCLYTVVGADGTIPTSEDDEIKRIGKALLVPHAKLLEIRSHYRDRLAILRGLPG